MRTAVHFLDTAPNQVNGQTQRFGLSYWAPYFSSLNSSRSRNMKQWGLLQGEAVSHQIVMARISLKCGGKIVCLQEDHRVSLEEILLTKLLHHQSETRKCYKMRNLEGICGSERTSHLETDGHSPKMPFSPWFSWEA